MSLEWGKGRRQIRVDLKESGRKGRLRQGKESVLQSFAIGESKVAAAERYVG